MCQLFVNIFKPPIRVFKRYYGIKHLRLSKMYPGLVSEGHLIGPENAMVDGTCKSKKLMLKLNIIQGAASGTFYMLPLLTRALEKLHRLIDQTMQSIGAQKVTTPCLASGKLWKKTGRWDAMGAELLKLKDRHNADLCLAPTHEEAITSIIANSVSIPAVKLPIKYYQIGRKFRDEPRPKNGLLRSREFEMKDLYTFDATLEAAEETYHEVCEAYSQLFEKLGLSTLKVEADTGAIGGSKSHEYHLESDIGEDTLLKCNLCNMCTNKEVMDLRPDQFQNRCVTEGCTGTWQNTTGIEIAHAFLLGTKYSEIFHAEGCDSENNVSTLQMGCFGIGVTRLLAAAAEVLSSDVLRWPQLLAPHQVCIIPQKQGYYFEETMALAESLQEELLAKPNLHNEVILDDRSKLTIGKRLSIADLYGIPYTIALGKGVQQNPPLFELNDNKGERQHLTREQLVYRLSHIETIIV